MFRVVAIVFASIAFVALQAHNFIVHKHDDVKQRVTHHHHTDGSSHTHNDDSSKSGDSHSPELGKFLFHKHDVLTFPESSAFIVLHSWNAIGFNTLRPTPLYYISPHVIIPRNPAIANSHFRGPPPTAML